MNDNAAGWLELDPPMRASSAAPKAGGSGSGGGSERSRAGDADEE